MSRRFPRNLSFEKCEQRQLLAVDLVIEVDDFEPAAVGEEVTRTVRVFNNGDEDANAAVVRASFPNLEKVTWERLSGFAPIVLKPPVEFEEPDLTITGNPRGVTLVGDVNHGGVPDVFVAGGREGSSYLVFGEGGGNAAPTTGLRVRFPSGRVPVHGLGDVNGDGIDDVSIGNTVLFGSQELGQATEIDLRSSSAHGIRLLSRFYEVATVMSVGDLNADGVNDLFVMNSEFSGIVFGGIDLEMNAPVLESEISSDRSVGFALPTLATGAQAIGDVNGDGLSDVAFDRPIGEEVWLDVLFGGPDVAERESYESTTFAVGNLLRAGSRFQERAPLARFAGDVNADGIDDLMMVFEGGECFDCTVSERFSFRTTGGVAVVFGNQDLGSKQIITSDSPGFIGATVSFGWSDGRPEGYSDDRNGDGVPDIVLNAGKDRQYVVFGGPTMRSYDFGHINDEFRGFRGDDGYLARARHATQSDVNGDGIREWNLGYDWATETHSVSFESSDRSIPSHSGLAASGSEPVLDVLDVPAGESAIYRLTGRVRSRNGQSFATAAPLREQVEDDYRNNIWPRMDAAYLDVKVEGELLPWEAASVEVTVKNHGPSNAIVEVDDAVSARLEGARWTSRLAPFPESIALKDWLPSYGPVMDLNWVSQAGSDGPYPAIEPLGDFNNDAFADFFVHGSGVHLGGLDFGAGGEFGDAVQSQSPNPRRLSGVLGDVNGDGFPDKVDSNSIKNRILFGDSDDVEQLLAARATSAHTLVLEDGRLPTEVRPLGDLNDDGLADMAVWSRDSNGLRILFGDPALQVGTMSVSEIDGPRFWPGSHFSNLRGNHDFNRDGVPDLLLENGKVFVVFGPFSPNSSDVNLAEIDSGESESSGLVFPGRGGDVGDFDGDGLLDVVVATDKNLGMVYFGPFGSNSEQRTLTLERDSIDFGILGLQFVAVSDINGDELDDIVVQDTVGGRFNGIFTPYPSGQAKLLFGRRAETRSGIGPIAGEFYLPSGSELTLQLTGMVKHSAPTGTVSLSVESNSAVSLNPLTTTVELEVSPALPGDLDGDGHVSFLDFLTLARSFGRTEVTFEDGDIDGDGNVGFLDFVILADNFGRRTSNNS